jgi:hypothetical protein
LALPAITWDSTPATLTGNIQTVLDGFFGTNNTVVVTGSLPAARATFAGNTWTSPSLTR